MTVAQLDRDPLARLRRQRNARLLHRLGSRALFEFIDELAKHHPDIADDVDRRLGRFAGIDPAALAIAGGDKFAAQPLRAVGGGR